MTLFLTILNGIRKGKEIPLSNIQHSYDSIEWIREDEAVEIKLSTTDMYESATLDLYDHSIQHTCTEIDTTGGVSFIWKPAYHDQYSHEKIFINFFGIAEFSITLKERGNDNVVIEHFNPIEVLASKINADRVDGMLSFLSKLPEEMIHSIFRTTKKGADFGEGAASPSFTLERIELLIKSLQHDFQLIFRHPITRLIPEQKIITASGFEDIDDNSMGWLLSNLSVLTETDNPQDAHIIHESSHLKASIIQLPILAENTDLYENKILHGFILQLTQEIHLFYKHYASYTGPNRSSFNAKPYGYSSFFDQISTFKNMLISEQIKRCDSVINTLKQMKVILEAKIPVKYGIIDRPIITPKVRHNHAYRGVFIKIIEWHESGKPDWSAYDNLFAIQNIPAMFETYCYIRTLLYLNKHFDTNQKTSTVKSDNFETQFIDANGTDIWLRREPTYWMTGHNNTAGDSFVNTEGWNYGVKKTLKQRATNGIYSHRRPDISIEIKYLNNKPTLLLLDAKYTNPDRAFTRFLPELTMKYVHGIHHIQHGEPVVSSLTIMHPCDVPSLKTFHHDAYNVYGKNPATPNLQSIGVIIKNESDDDDGFDNLLERILLLNGINVSDISAYPVHNVSPTH
ncbi:DUF2357 domain-containing protein [Aeromonas hydrophila]|uniref:DUF2357 domain-containing protein n=1 Tax=Aeromonas hydrophila TaxID=644 RepID=UPI002B48E46D|nr:DUF2357 domain-containing protein [Aeromonas hydrophila]